MIDQFPSPKQGEIVIFRCASETLCRKARSYRRACHVGGEICSSARNVHLTPVKFEVSLHAAQLENLYGGGVVLTAGDASAQVAVREAVMGQARLIEF